MARVLWFAQFLLLVTLVRAQGSGESFYVVDLEGTSYEVGTGNFSRPRRFVHPWQWYGNFTIGAPALSWAGVLDSGSSFLELLCQGVQLPDTCNLTTQAPPTVPANNASLFSPSNSTLLSESQCSLVPRASLSEDGNCTYQLTENGINTSAGYFINSFITLGDSQLRTPLVAGCDTVNTACSKGSLGVSSGQLSLPTQLAAKGFVSREVGWCLDLVNPGSFLLFGTAVPKNVSLLTAALLPQSASPVNNSGRYYVEAKAITIGRNPANIQEANRAVLIDTATPGLQVPVRVLDELTRQIANATARINNTEFLFANTSMGNFPCVRTTNSSNTTVTRDTLAFAFPDLVLSLTGGGGAEWANVSMVPEQYVDAYPDPNQENRTMLCARVSVNPVPGYTLGANAYLNKFVQVDPVNQTFSIATGAYSCSGLQTLLTSNVSAMSVPIKLSSTMTSSAAAAPSARPLLAVVSIVFAALLPLAL